MNDTELMGKLSIQKGIRWKLMVAMVGMIVAIVGLLTVLQVTSQKAALKKNLTAHSSFLKEQMTNFINLDEDIEPEPEKKVEEKEKIKFNENLYKNVEELELSVRSANCLKKASIVKIYQLVSKTESEMLKTKNFGRKSLNEIKEVLIEMDLSLGMKLEGME